MQQLLFIVLVYLFFLGTTDFQELQSFHRPLQGHWPRQTKTLRHLQEFCQYRPPGHCASLPKRRTYPYSPCCLTICSFAHSAQSAWAQSEQGAPAKVSHSKRSELGSQSEPRRQKHIPIPSSVLKSTAQLNLSLNKHKQRNMFFILVQGYF